MKARELSGTVDIFGIIEYNFEDVISNIVCKNVINVAESVQ